MPQLDILTFGSQFFWFFVLFNLFYFVTVKDAIPTIYKILQARSLAASLNTTDNNAKSNTAQQNVSTSVLQEYANLSSKYIANVALSTKTRLNDNIKPSALNAKSKGFLTFNTKYLRNVALRQGQISILSRNK